jgi:hypothetical protein
MRRVPAPRASHEFPQVVSTPVTATAEDDGGSHHEGVMRNAIEEDEDYGLESGLDVRLDSPTFARPHSRPSEHPPSSIDSVNRPNLEPGLFRTSSVPPTFIPPAQETARPRKLRRVRRSPSKSSTASQAWMGGGGGGSQQRPKTQPSYSADEADSRHNHQQGGSSLSRFLTGSLRRIGSKSGRTPRIERTAVLDEQQRLSQSRAVSEGEVAGWELNRDASRSHSSCIL